MRQEMMGFWDGSGISWTISQQSAPRSRQITTTTPHQSFFTDWMLFLTPKQQCQSTEGNNFIIIIIIIITVIIIMIVCGFARVSCSWAE